ncbi:unnamed protein product [Amoebophrya sp. A120]|nr:unnamed protein product [Amoebophrya sp. A120]|eukprot:GSA120T00013586001.1
MAILKTMALAAASTALLAGNGGVDAVEVLMSNQNKMATAQNKKKMSTATSTKKTAELHKKAHHKKASQHQESQKVSSKMSEKEKNILCDEQLKAYCEIKGKTSTIEKMAADAAKASLDAQGCSTTCPGSCR